MKICARADESPFEISSSSQNPSVHLCLNGQNTPSTCAEGRLEHNHHPRSPCPSFRSRSLGSQQAAYGTRLTASRERVYRACLLFPLPALLTTKKQATQSNTDVDEL